eukprot:2228641-Rhodomonas_salina.1
MHIWEFLHPGTRCILNTPNPGYPGTRVHTPAADNGLVTNNSVAKKVEILTVHVYPVPWNPAASDREIYTA